jgi:dihydroorotate dehydrogenase (NAD+) catalytic subunit
VIGSGGAMNGRDVLEFLAVGARAVQIGTASFIRPRAAQEVIDEMTAWLAARGHRSVERWIGCLAAAPAAAPRTRARGASRIPEEARR